ncbi:MAG: hypothetical protein AAB433_08795, partial [Nitrospirota bacterium]
KVNPALFAGRTVSSFVVTSDSSTAVYRANQDTAAIVELYRTTLSSAGTSTKLNAALVVGEDVTDFAVR